MLNQKVNRKTTIYPFGDDVYHPFLVKMAILGNGLSRATDRSCSNPPCNPGAVHDGDPTWGRFAEHETRRHFSHMFVYRIYIYTIIYIYIYIYYIIYIYMIYMHIQIHIFWSTVACRDLFRDGRVRRVAEPWLDGSPPLTGSTLMEIGT